MAERTEIIKATRSYMELDRWIGAAEALDLCWMAQKEEQRAAVMRERFPYLQLPGGWDVGWPSFGERLLTVYVFTILVEP